ncbi:hypothetical protein DS745_05025 [Anaerobacillus alkaliphilus]|uniref:Uncharacterized protein n=1 Tax=Anaerobacillus alkaliphilus TaxID=1548597 RepID=A0A4Q0VVT5_9BACI|nr:S8 family serine peptidase [Anaerobacillus alkaliphilus]RXJ02948.1 hypothetical protein DS745_05025 [Anaerobacillus alkaliphilus]
MRFTNKKIVSALLVLILVFSTFMPTYAVVEQTPERDQQTVLEKLNLSLEDRRDVHMSQVADERLKPSEDTLIVKYKSPISVEQHQRSGATLSKRISSLGYDIVRLQRNQKMENVIAAYRKLSNVESVTPSYPYQKLETNDPKSTSMYHLSQLRINEALKLAGKHEVVVAVIDSGLDQNHPELKNKLLPDYNAVNPLKRGMADMHGTHVAGIIAAEANNGIGGMGINPNAKILPIDVFGREWGAYDYSIAEGIMHAIEKKANVINMSLGSFFPSPIIEEAVEKAIDAGIVVVAAAGNSGSNMKGYPASFPGVISVGATNENKELAQFSTYGPSVDIVAPGEDVYAPVFDVDKRSSFIKASGTSMASPVVAGVASLLLSKYPNLTPYEVKYILEKTAKDLGAPGYDVKFGYGLVDPVAALKYDVKQVPKQPMKEEEAIQRAKVLQFGGKAEAVVSDTITVPQQQNWVRFNMVYGELAQIVLDVPENYDYTLVLQYSSAGINETIEINEASEGKVEAILYEAKDSGTLYIGVKDANEKYDEKGKSEYSLTVTKHGSILEDGNNAENVEKIDKFPYKTNKFYLAGEDGDSDYFSFAVEEAKVVEVRLGAIPGINSSIKVYMADEFNMYASELMHMPKPENPWDYFGPYPMFQRNNNGTSEGEVLVFDAMPGMEYVIEVTSNADYYFDPYYYFYMEEFGEKPDKLNAANVPYELSIVAEVLPPDEDGFPNFGFGMPPMFEEGMEYEEYHQKRNAYEETYYDYYYGGYYWGEDYVYEILNAAIPLDHDEAVEGYFQYSGDVDVFTIVPEKTGIYELHFNKTETMKPSMEVMKYTEDEEGVARLTTIAYSGSYYYYYPPVVDDETEKSVYVGLEKGEQYVITLSNNYSPSLDSYTLATKLILENPQDAYYGNDTFENAKPLPKYSFTGNFALSETMDVFYMKADKDAVYGLHVENGDVPKRLKETLPKELFEPLWPMVAIVEDRNGNGELDKEEERGAMSFYGYNSPDVRASFKAKKGSGYFVIIMKDYYYGGTANLTPYRVTLSQVDEKTSVIIPFSEVANGTWQTKGFLPFGDPKKTENRYRFTAETKGTYEIKFDMPSDIDGVLAIYTNTGRLIKEVDYYGAGDAEFLTLTLNKGSYFIGVKDYFGHTSVSPYTLSVKKK